MDIATIGVEDWLNVHERDAVWDIAQSTIASLTMDELRLIRQLWLDEKHEFEDTLPGIYESVTGRPYDDGTISKNKYFGAAEAGLLQAACQTVCPDETLMYELQRALLDIEAKAEAISNKRNVIQKFEREIQKAFYRSPEEAEQLAQARTETIAGMLEPFDDVDWTE